MFEGPASIFDFLPVDEILHLMGFTVRPGDEFVIVDEINGDGVPIFGGIPYKR